MVALFLVLDLLLNYIRVEEAGDAERVLSIQTFSFLQLIWLSRACLINNHRHLNLIQRRSIHVGHDDVAGRLHQIVMKDLVCHHFLLMADFYAVLFRLSRDLQTSNAIARLLDSDVRLLLILLPLFHIRHGGG